jgi:hypothetical protein
MAVSPDLVMTEQPEAPRMAPPGRISDQLLSQTFSGP